MTREQLLAEIEGFLSRPDVKMTESTFGRLAVNDGKLVPRLREGKGITLDTAAKITTFIREYRPAVQTETPAEATAAAKPSKPQVSSIRGSLQFTVLKLC